MCGIVGYVGKDEALPIILEGLRRLEYRGYDSAGVALVDGGIHVRKRSGKLSELDRLLHEDPLPGAVVGMGHTRWATHGEPTDRNAHPHLDCGQRIAVIHNGIIENFSDLRARLEKEGHRLRSDTDTECIAHLIERHFEGDLAGAVRATIRELEGAYAMVGLGDGENLLASDIPAVLSRTRSVIPVREGQVVEVGRNAVRVTDFDGNEVEPERIEIDWDVGRAQKSGFDHFMLKEIHEQPAAIRDTLVGRIDAPGHLSLDELRVSEDVLRNVDKVFVVACGTAFHAGLVAKYAIEHLTRLPVEIEIASEFRYRDPVLDAGTLTLGVSQSGETIDTLEAVRHAGNQRSHVLAITNTLGSSITREADGVFYTHAGPEICVASTKTFATQMVALDLVALYLAQVRGTKFPHEVAEIVAEMRDLPEKVERAIELDAQVRAVADRYAGARDFLFIGRHTGYPAALEGALKLKELSYIHAEGYPAGELKHGPIALVEEGV